MSNLTDRLRALSHAVTMGREVVEREFTMRVPAEPERDADIVLFEAAKLIDRYEKALEAVKLEAGSHTVTLDHKGDPDPGSPFTRLYEIAHKALDRDLSEHEHNGGSDDAES